MTDELYILPLVALLPITSVLLVVQENPYHALVIRGIVGAVAALVYALLGAADVALTEALVGTMLAITLYAVAARSSMAMRLGVLEGDIHQSANSSKGELTPGLNYTLAPSLRQLLEPHHLRLEVIPYPDLAQLQKALSDRHVHAIASPQSLMQDPVADDIEHHLYTRVRQLHQILDQESLQESCAVQLVDLEAWSQLPHPQHVGDKHLESQSSAQEIELEADLENKQVIDVNTKEG